MADQYGLFSMRGRNDGSSVENEDFDEEQVWAVVERKDISPKVRKSNRDTPVSAPRHVPTAARVIPRFSSPTEGRVQYSAPVNIPDWSKIYRNNSSENHGFKDGSWASYGVGDGDGVSGHNDGDSNEEDDDDDDNDQIPPHEWLARKLARSQISSFSVCEGAGRTLKGRDLSKVRNAILTRTGFLE